MTEQDLPTFLTRVMAPLYLAFAREPDAALSNLYFADLRDFSLSDVIGATDQARRRLTFFPKVAELRAIVLGSDDMRAARAWGRVHNAALKRYGTYRPLDFG